MAWAEWATQTRADLLAIANARVALPGTPPSGTAPIQAGDQWSYLVFTPGIIGDANRFAALLQDSAKAPEIERDFPQWAARTIDRLRTGTGQASPYGEAEKVIATYYSQASYLDKLKLAGNDAAGRLLRASSSMPALPAAPPAPPAKPKPALPAPAPAPKPAPGPAGPAPAPKPAPADETDWTSWGLLGLLVAGAVAWASKGKGKGKS